jgi:hypothetical protein
MASTEVPNYGNYENQRRLRLAGCVLAGSVALAAAGCGSAQTGSNSEVECQSLPVIVVAPIFTGNTGYQLIGGTECITQAYDSASKEPAGYITPNTVFQPVCLEQGGYLRAVVYGISMDLGRELAIPTGEDTFDIVPPPDMC